MTSPDEETGPGLELFAKFNLAINSLTSEIKKQNRREQQRLQMLPNYMPFSQMVIAGGPTAIQDFGGPQPGREWIVRLLYATPSPISTYGTTVVQASNTFAAAAAGSVSLPAGAAITSFTVNFLPAAANVNGIITVTNASGGTMSYETGIGTGGGGTDVAVPYSPAIPATTSSAQITVNMPAVVGGPAYSITVTGTTTTTSPTVTWYVGQNMPGPAAGQLPQTMSRWQFNALPQYKNFTSTVITVAAGERLIAGLTGLTTNASYALTVIVEDQPTRAQRMAVAVE